MLNISTFPPLSSIIIIAGIIFIFVALVAIRGKYDIQVRNEKNEKLVLFFGITLFALGLLVAVTGITGQSEPTTTTTPTTIKTKTTTPSPEVRITSPLNTAKISDIITGTSKNIPSRQKVWILIYPHTANKYYPQNQVDGENWNLPAQFGEDKDAGTKFDVVAVLADQNAQNELQAYYDKSLADKKWDGIRDLPGGTKELVRVTVTRV